MDKQHSKHHEGYTSNHQMMIRDFRVLFWISLIVSAPILLLSTMIQDIIGYEIKFSADNYILFILSAFVFFYGGWPFLTGIVNEVKQKQPGMMTLIAVAITVAFGYSTATTFGLKGKTFFWELATLIDVMLLGHWIEMKSVASASRSLQKLVELMPSEAHEILNNGETRDVKVNELSRGDKALIKPGDKIPVDGIIYDGKSNVDESMVTGESKPVRKQKDDHVIGGAINDNSSLKVKVEQAGDKAYLNKVIDIV